MLTNCIQKTFEANCGRKLSDSPVFIDIQDDYDVGNTTDANMVIMTRKSVCKLKKLLNPTGKGMHPAP